MRVRIGAHTEKSLYACETTSEGAESERNAGRQDLGQPQLPPEVVIDSHPKILPQKCLSLLLLVYSTTLIIVH